MSVALASRDRRALAFGGAFLLGALALARGVPAWLAWRADARATAGESVAQKAAWDALAATFSESMDTLEARGARLAAAVPVLLPGETHAATGATLSGHLAQVSREALVRLDAVDIRVDSAPRTMVSRITAEVQATADIAGLAAFLHALERGPVLLVVRSLSVHSAAGSASVDQQVELLTVRFAVEGIALRSSTGTTP